MIKADIIRGLLREAIQIAGSQDKLAAACIRLLHGKVTAYSQNAISQALKQGRVSPRLAMCIQEATDGKVRAYELCPDDPWLQQTFTPSRLHANVSSVE